MHLSCSLQPSHDSSTAAAEHHAQRKHSLDGGTECLPRLPLDPLLEIGMAPELKAAIDDLINNNKIVVFMKVRRV